MAKTKKKDDINIIFMVSEEELSERFTYAVSEYIKRHGLEDLNKDFAKEEIA